MEIALVLGVVFLALISFIAEWVPVDITAIIVMVTLIVLGLVTPEQGIAGFGNSATVTVMAMFILSAGIARTGAIQAIGDLLFRLGGKRASQQVFILGAITGPITAFINNTAVVAVFLPIVEDWCRKRQISPTQLLIPLSYVTILGGMITVIGTSTNILASGLSEKLGYGEFSLFQFTALGMITFLIGLTYLALFAPRLLPNRSAASGTVSDAYGLKEYVSEVSIPSRSTLVGKTLRASQLQRKYDIDVLELIRYESHFPQPLADKTLLIGDILLVRGTREDLLKLRDERDIDILPEVQFGQKALSAEGLADSEEGLGEALILSNSNLIGSTLKDLRFRQRYNVTVLAIRRGQELVRERLGKVPLRFGDILLLQGPKQSFLGLQTSRDLLAIEQRDVETLRRDKAGIAIAIGLMVVLLAAFDLLPILVSALVGVVLMVLTGCLKPGELYGAVRWDIIFLLAGLIPLGQAMENSGATSFLADKLVTVGGHLSGYWLLVFFFAITALVTEILSNNASVVLLLPVAVKVAEQLDLNPFAFMFAVTFAASNSFMTPIGYQTNTMVYSAGGYKFLDFTRVGAPLALIMTLVVPPLIILLYGL